MELRAVNGTIEHDGASVAGVVVVNSFDAEGELPGRRIEFDLLSAPHSVVSGKWFRDNGCMRGVCRKNLLWGAPVQKEQVAVARQHRPVARTQYHAVSTINQVDRPVCIHRFDPRSLLDHLDRLRRNCGGITSGDLRYRSQKQV